METNTRVRITPDAVYADTIAEILRGSTATVLSQCDDDGYLKLKLDVPHEGVTVVEIHDHDLEEI
jgi:hypothetical protein